jgi:hypothetical protein
MTSEIKKEDYYENMYDIENLTELNKSNEKTKKSSSVLEIEKLIKNNRCNDARIKIKQALLKEKTSRIEILNGALWVKDRVFSEFISPNFKNLSPKSCALKELSLYLKKTEKIIEKKC